MTEVADIKKMIVELYNRPVIPDPMIEIVVLIFHLDIIWAIVCPIKKTRVET